VTITLPAVLSLLAWWAAWLALSVAELLISTRRVKR